MNLRGQECKPLKRTVTIRIGSPLPSATDQSYKNLFSPLPTKVELSSASSSTSLSDSESSTTSSSTSQVSSHQASTSLSTAQATTTNLRLEDVRSKKINKVPSSSVLSTDKRKSSSSIRRTSSLRLALKRSVNDVGGQVVSSGKKGKKKGTKRKVSVSSSSESSIDQQTTESSRTSIPPSSTTSSSSLSALPNTKSISSTTSPSNTIETISASNTTQPPTTLLSSFTTTNPSQHIVPNIQGRGALPRHIEEGLQIQDGTPTKDLRCSVLFKDPDDRPVLCPGIITDVYRVSPAHYKIVVDFDHKETLTLSYPCKDRRIFLHKKRWQTATLLAKQNNQDVRVSLSFMKPPPSSTMSTSQVPSTSSSSSNALPDKEQLKVIQKNIMKSIKSAHTSSEGEPPKLFDVTQDTISTRPEYTVDDIPEHLKHLINYRQSSGRPDDYNVETACPFIESIFQGEDNFLDSVEHIKDINGNPIDWNTLSLPKRCRDPESKKKLVVLIAYYQTTEERKSCRDLHSFRSRRSDGSNRSHTPDFIRASLSEEIFNECAAVDMYPFPMPHGGSPLEVLTQENFDYVMKMWVKHVLDLLMNDDRVVIALCSKTTGVVFAKHVLNGSIKKLHELYKKNPYKFISAVLGKLVLNYHPESIYNLLYWIMMEIKCMTSDAFFTNVLKAVTGDDNVAPCTFARGLLEDGNNSAVFAFIQAAHLEKCGWGGSSCCKKRDDAALTYLVHIQAGLTDEQALDSIKYEMGDEYHSLAVGYLKFCWMSRLAVQLERGEEIDMTEVIKFTTLVGMDVDDLMKNAEACREGSAEGRATGQAKGQAKFTIMAQLSAMMKFVDGEAVLAVDDDVVVEMATRCNMKKDDLLKGAKAIKKGRANAQATIVSKGRVSWKTRWDELVEYKEEHGNCKVPRGYKANESLATWVANQRYEYKKLIEGKSSYMTEDRIDKLNEVDFEWELLKLVSWDERFNQLLMFKDEFKHCNVPWYYSANPQLSTWASTQRTQFRLSEEGKPSHLTAERIKKLNDAGFGWKLK